MKAIEAEWDVMAKQGMRERIGAAFGDDEVRLRFYDLALRLWPDPESWRYSSNGGPPGCAMALSAAIRRHGIPYSYDGGNRWVYRPTKKPA